MQGEISTDALTRRNRPKSNGQPVSRAFADAGDEPAATLCRIRIVRRQDRLTYQTVRIGGQKGQLKVPQVDRRFVRVR